MINVNFSNDATWNTTGYSKVDSLVLDGANLNFEFSGAYDRIVATSLSFGDENNISISLSEWFADEIFYDFDGDFDGEFTFNIDQTINGAAAGDVEANSQLDIATGNSAYTWEVESLGSGDYRLYNFREIPEPATYAAIFGALALAFAAYRRRK